MIAFSETDRKHNGAALQGRSNYFRTFDELAQHLSRRFSAQERWVAEIRDELAAWEAAITAGRTMMVKKGVLRQT